MHGSFSRIDAPVYVSYSLSGLSEADPSSVSRLQDGVLLLLGISSESIHITVLRRLEVCYTGACCK